MSSASRWLLRLRRLWVGLAIGLLVLSAVLFRDSVTLDVAATWMLAALLVVGWTTFGGPAQEVSLGHALFFGGAGYVAALFQLRAGFHPILALLAASGCTAVVGGLLALLTARHRGLYFSMVTMAVQIAVYRVLYLRGDIFGGEEGLTGIPVAIVNPSELYVAAGMLLLAGALAANRFLRSRTGLLLGAVGQHETLARSLGANLTILRVAGLSMAAATASLGGAAWALTQGYVSPDLAGEELSARAALLGCIGGLWSIPGAVVASVGWDSFRFLLSRFTDWSGPISSGLLLGLVARPTRRSGPSRPTWDHLPISSTPLRAEGAVAVDDTGLILRDVRVRFGGLNALQGVTFTLPKGRAIGVLGQNGAGKTTLLNAIAGLVPATGEMHWAGVSLTRLGTAARARAGVRKTFQHPARFPDFSAWEHLQVAIAASSVRPLEGIALQRLLTMCEPVRSRAASEMNPATLRFLEMAMALVAPPGLLLLDEPYAGLSASQAEVVSAAIDELKSAGVTLLIVEHRLADMLRSIDDMVVIGRGRVLRTGPAAEVLADREVAQLYLRT
jgi:ABC-type branched-subunit amino acid transport system ATPase component/ABC-type branched-subunit amino acid transport system permease subunit